ncbi:MBL fold metallo-hydrolase [Saccharopolyspora rhizosphaerae]|uniref:hypothetical protein n=1 Tax=Saccharopolyspora rhizosphaerae TaxID=2492662 RepID=UPI0018F59610
MADDVEVNAIRFAQRDTSVRGEHFYGHDPCAMEACPISYYVWLAVSDNHTVLVDAGCTPDTAAGRGNRDYLQSPMDTMLYLFGTPSQSRFWFLWEDLSAARSVR